MMEKKRKEKEKYEERSTHLFYKGTKKHICQNKPFTENARYCIQITQFPKSKPEM